MLINTLWKMSFHLQASHTRSSFFPSSFLFTHETSVYATSSSTRCTKAFHGAGKSLIDTHMMKKQQKFFVYSFRHRHTERKTFPTRPNFFLLRSLNILFSPPPSDSPRVHVPKFFPLLCWGSSTLLFWTFLYLKFLQLSNRWRIRRNKLRSREPFSIPN